MDQITEEVFADVRQQYPKDQQGKSIVKVYPFNSAKKMMSTVIRLENGKYRLLVKGASEIVLASCTTQQNADGKVIPLEETEKVTTRTPVLTFLTRV